MTDPLSRITEGAMLKIILNAQAEGLTQEGVDDRPYLDLFPRLRHRLEPLIATARLLKTFLVPMRPSSEFREGLREGLLTAAGQRPPAGSTQHPLWHEWRARRRELVIGAAAVGSAVSLAGVAALIIRARLAHQREEQVEAT